MAGNYPSPTARRINYNLIGARCWYKTANAASTPLTEDGSFMGNMNNESAGTTPVLTLNWNSGTNPGHAPFVLLKFPAAVDISGIKGWTGNGPVAVHVSNNTTNGVDGTWTAGSSFTPATAGTQREWSRSTSGANSITAQSFSDVRWLRLSLPQGSSGNRQVGKVLIYGNYHSATDTLDFWDSSLDQQAAPDVFEFGDRGRLITTTKQFRIKNRSSSMTAKSITVSHTITSDTTPSVPGFHSFSLDGTSWSGTLSLGDLAPGTISPVIQMRQVVPSNAVLWLWQMVVMATPSTWE